MLTYAVHATEDSKAFTEKTTQFFYLIRIADISQSLSDITS